MQRKVFSLFFLKRRPSWPRRPLKKADTSWIFRKRKEIENIFNLPVKRNPTRHCAYQAFSTIVRVKKLASVIKFSRIKIFYHIYIIMVSHFYLSDLAGKTISSFCFLLRFISGKKVFFPSSSNIFSADIVQKTKQVFWRDFLHFSALNPRDTKMHRKVPPQTFVITSQEEA